jgi:hypothetical protein
MHARTPKRTFSEITGRLIAALTNALEGRRCRVFSPDQRVKIPGSRFYTDPDAKQADGSWASHRFRSQRDVAAELARM